MCEISHSLSVHLLDFNPPRSPVSNISPSAPSLPAFTAGHRREGTAILQSQESKDVPWRRPRRFPYGWISCWSWFPGSRRGAQLEQTCPKTSHLPRACQAQLSHGACQSWSWSGDLELSSELLWLHTGHLSSRQEGFFYGQGFPEHSESVDAVRSFLEQTSGREMHPSCQMHLQTQTVLLGSTFCCPRPQGLSLHPLEQWGEPTPWTG